MDSRRLVVWISARILGSRVTKGAGSAAVELRMMEVWILLHRLDLHSDRAHPMVDLDREAGHWRGWATLMARLKLLPAIGHK